MEMHVGVCTDTARQDGEGECHVGVFEMLQYGRGQTRPAHRRREVMFWSKRGERVACAREKGGRHA